MIEHVAERGGGAGAVAGKLRRLRAQQLGQRRVAEMLARFGGEPGRRARVARADSGHAAGKRGVALLAPPRLGGERHQRRQAENEANDAPGERDEDRQPDDDAKRDPQRDVVFDAVEGQRDVAGVLGQPGEPIGGERQQDEKQQQANHDQRTPARSGAAHDLARRT